MKIPLKTFVFAAAFALCLANLQLGAQSAASSAGAASSASSAGSEDEKIEDSESPQPSVRSSSVRSSSSSSSAAAGSSSSSSASGSGGGSSSSSSNIIVVSGAKIEETIDDSVEKVQVVTAQAIKESGAKTLTEAMKNIPGVVVTGASAGNPVDSISMQGFDSAYVKILVDGVAVSGDIAGSVSVFQIPVENIDHIEVVQGATSALYGSDAMGGVVNIITKKTKSSEKLTFGGSLTQELSSNFRSYTGLNADFSVAGFTANVSAAYDYSAGKKDYYDFEPLYQTATKYYKTPHKELSFARLVLGRDFDMGSAGLTASITDSLQKSNYTAVGLDTAAVTTYESDRIEGGLNGEYYLSDTMTLSAFTSLKYFTLDTDSPLVDVSDDLSAISSVENAQETDSLDEETEVRLAWDPNLYNSVLIGFNMNFQSIEGDAFSGTEKQVLLSLYAQDTVALADETFFVVPGLRFDFSPSVGGSDTLFSVTPKISLKWNPAEDTTVRFSYGMGFRVPTLKQKYWVFYHNYASGDGNFILYGNTDLDPERSQSFNLAVEKKFSPKLAVTLSGYYNYITDLIDSVVIDSESSPQIRTYENIDKAMTFGGEIGLSGKINRLDWKAGYALTQAYQYEDGDFDELTLRVPHRVTASAGYMIPKAEVKVTLNGEWNAPRLLTSSGGDEYSPDYLMCGLNISKTLWSGRLEVYAHADNLLNNLHFKDGTDGDSQKEYFGLNDGAVFTVGASFKL